MKIKIIIVIMLTSLLAACSARIPYAIVADYPAAEIKVVAVLPVKNMTKHDVAGQLLRNKVWRELYHKGYETIPLELVDEAISQYHKEGGVFQDGHIKATRLRQKVNMDAAMRITLIKAGSRYRAVYATTEVAAALELINAKTGELLWRSQHRAARVSWGLTRRDMEMKVHLVFEEAMNDVVNKIMASLPEGAIFNNPVKTKDSP